MNRYFYVTIVIVFLFFSSSCTESANRQRAVKAMKERLNGYEEIVGERDIVLGKTTIANEFNTIKVPRKIEDSIFRLVNIIDRTRYVKLETDTNCLVGAIDKLYFSEDRIIVVDKRKSQSIFIFDTSGKFINKINQKGGGPGEFKRISDVCFKNDSNEIVLFDDANNRCSYYSIDGKFIKSERVGFFFGSFEYLGNNLFIHTLFPGSNPHISIIEDNDIAITENCKRIVSTLRNHYNPFPKINEYESRYSLMQSNNSSYFTPLFSDTVFQPKPGGMGLEAVFCIGFEENDMIYSMKREASMSEFFQGLNQGNSYLFEGKILTLGDCVYYEVVKKNYCAGFYSKKTKKFVGGMGYTRENCPDVEYYNFPLAVAGNEFVSIIDPPLIMMSEKVIKEEDPSHVKKRNRKLSNLLGSMTNMDNPVLVFYTIKDF